MSFKLSCGCIPDASGYGYCNKCTTALRRKIWAEMSQKERNYDRHFATSDSEDLDRYYNPDNQHNSCCSCHINPPCSYCTSKSNEDE